MIRIENLTFWYSKKNQVFDNLDLELESGHIYGLMGKNGAGKTTLFKLICGLSFPKSGIVSVDGRTPADRQPGFLADIFLVPEEISVPALTPGKFAEINGGFYLGFDQSRFSELLEKFELDAGQNCLRMSNGQRKKMMLAFALTANTRYLLLDEPTNGLDIPSKAAFRSVLASALTEDTTIILSTHMVRELESLIDSVIILDGHRIILDKTIDQVARKLSFSRGTFSHPDEEMIYSSKCELGPTIVSVNSSSIPGEVDIEALFNACVNVPEKISTCFNQ
jgi:ABC-2 type transport system ATP-binding protein